MQKSRRRERLWHPDTSLPHGVFMNRLICPPLLALPGWPSAVVRRPWRRHCKIFLEPACPVAILARPIAVAVPCSARDHTTPASHECFIKRCAVAPCLVTHLALPCTCEDAGGWGKAKANTRSKLNVLRVTTQILEMRSAILNSSM